MHPRDDTETERPWFALVAHIGLILILLLGLTSLTMYGLAQQRSAVPVMAPGATPTPIQVVYQPPATSTRPRPTPTQVLPTPTQPPPTPTPRVVAAVDARIAVTAAQEGGGLVHVTAYLLFPGSLEAVPCEFDRPVRLWRGGGDQPASLVKFGTRRLVTQGAQTFPVWEFNTVDTGVSGVLGGRGALAVSAADALAASQTYFYVTVDGISTNSTIWSASPDARTFLPIARAPLEAGGEPSDVDARIQIVWPHDNLPITEAKQVNITVALFHANQNRAIDPTWDGKVQLFQAFNAGPMRPVALGVKRLVNGASGLRYAVWDFNDIDVSAAQDPLNKYYFAVRVETLTTQSTIWSHGADARTHAPAKEQIKGSC